MGKRAIIGYVVGLPVMRVLAARIRKTAIAWRTRTQMAGVVSYGS
jgi:hypothetical protein